MSGLYQLHDLGQSVWYDNIERSMITSGKLESLIELGVRGITSNPTIFEKAVSRSTVYDEVLIAGRGQGKSTEELYDELAIADIVAAADKLRAVYESSQGSDGYVSLEVSPQLARNTEGTIREGLRLNELVARPNAMIKVPATKEGIEAIEQLIAEGVNVNATLVFWIGQYQSVMDAYIKGIESRIKAGKSVSRIHSVASFFISRIDDAVDKIVLERGMTRDFLGKAAISNAKVAYRKFREAFASERFAHLRQQGANMQRILWASTGPKNPAYPHLLYVRSLVGRDTVNTMPPHILDLAQKQRNYADVVENDVENADSLLRELKVQGIDIDEVAKALLDAGVDAFTQSYENLMLQIDKKASRTHS